MVDTYKLYRACPMVGGLTIEVKLGTPIAGSCKIANGFTFYTCTQLPPDTYHTEA